MSSDLSNLLLQLLVLGLPSVLTLTSYLLPVTVKMITKISVSERRLGFLLTAIPFVATQLALTYVFSYFLNLLSGQDMIRPSPAIYSFASVHSMATIATLYTFHMSTVYERGIAYFESEYAKIAQRIGALRAKEDLVYGQDVLSNDGSTAGELISREVAYLRFQLVELRKIIAKARGMIIKIGQGQYSSKESSAFGFLIFLIGIPATYLSTALLTNYVWGPPFIDIPGAIILGTLVAVFLSYLNFKEGKVFRMMMKTIRNSSDLPEWSKNNAMKNTRVSTPPKIVDIMVGKLFEKRTPTEDDILLDPGCGSGAFIKGVLAWCGQNHMQTPHIVGVDIDPTLIDEASRSITDSKHVRLLNEDFLLGDFGDFDFIVGNPPYLRLEALSRDDRKRYREQFETARNRFDLYVLFFEKALKSLKRSGRLVFITPEKYEYTLSTTSLRKLMTRHHITEIHHINEDTFEGLVTYPTITVIEGSGSGDTKITHRDGSSTTVQLPADGSPWVSAIRGEVEPVEPTMSLCDICVRISCGVATGMDDVFVMPKGKVPKSLSKLAYQTVGGEDLGSRDIKRVNRMIIPYDSSGLLPEGKLKSYLRWLSKDKDRLTGRYCVKAGKKKWYEFHERPPMKDMLRPKILCKDIAKEPKFWIDTDGMIVPRHSVYYIVPKDPGIIRSLSEYLNGEQASRWLVANCQRAANGFLRLQSSILKRLPIPQSLTEQVKKR